MKYYRRIGRESNTIKMIGEEKYFYLESLLDDGDVVIYIGLNGNAWETCLSSMKNRICFHPVLSTAGVDIDNYCRNKSIPHVNLLILDDADIRVMHSADMARRLLENEAVDFIWFECNSASLDHEILSGIEVYGYSLFSLSGTGKLKHVSSPDYGLSRYVSDPYLSVCARLHRYVINDRKGMFNYVGLFSKYGISPDGLIHVGAHHGEEIDNYKIAGVKKIIMIEADPESYSVLSKNCDAYDDIITINALVADEECEVEFHRMSSSQSSSMFDLKDHSRIYSSITKTDTVRLHATPLDKLIDELDIDENEYNVLALDTQGAELKILHGARRTLKHIDAIITEVNYKELYEGGAFIWDLDRYLEDFGFKRMETVSPHHPSWGDAFYIRT